MNIKPKWVPALGARRVAAIAGAAGLALGAAVLTAGSAVASNGIQPGNLTLTPTSGPLTTNATWSTTDACPTGFQGSAIVVIFNTSGTFASNISQVQQPATAAFTNVAFLPGTTMSTLLGVTNVTVGGTVEMAVQCWSGSGATGSSEYVQSTFVTEATATTYTSSGTGPVTFNTTTTLTASPTTGTVGTAETLTATEIATDGTHPAGSVQFTAGGTNIGTPVAVNASGVATQTTTPSAAGTDALTAVFTPSVTGYNASTGTLSLVVNPAGSQTAGVIPINVTVPPTGALTVTVATTAITLAVTGTTAPLTGTGTLNNVTVSDTRNTAPGWSVSGQESVFTETPSGTGTIAADELGWVPTAVNPLVGGATLGPTVAPGASPGLGDAAQVLASATAGNGIGTNTLSANLTLDIPATTPAGSYTGNMTITYLLS